MPIFSPTVTTMRFQPTIVPSPSAMASAALRQVSSGFLLLRNIDSPWSLDGGIHSQPSRVWKDAAKEDYWRAGGPGSSEPPQFLFTQPKVVSQFVAAASPGSGGAPPLRCRREPRCFAGKEKSDLADWGKRRSSPFEGCRGTLCGTLYRKEGPFAQSPNANTSRSKS